jgi:aryl-alcohol dehydrogenase-like predicted oxidoreductase
MKFHIETLGRTGEKASLIGLGGYQVGSQSDPEESVRIIRTGIDEGITFLDNCWDYNGGESEIRMGKAPPRCGLHSGRPTNWELLHSWTHVRLSVPFW